MLIFSVEKFIFFEMNFRDFTKIIFVIFAVGVMVETRREHRSVTTGIRFDDFEEFHLAFGKNHK